MRLPVFLLHDVDAPMAGRTGDVMDYPAKTAMRLVAAGHAIPLNDAAFEFPPPVDRAKFKFTVRGGDLHEHAI
jgi:hypothetical protein